MRYGHEQEFNSAFEKLWDQIGNTGEGLFWSSGYGGMIDAPDGSVEFVISQLHRFNIPVHEGIFEFLERCVSWTLTTFSVSEPYALFFDGASDVSITFEWTTKTFEIQDMNDDMKFREADPDDLETFMFYPGRDEQIFNECLASPGLENLPSDIGIIIEHSLKGYYGHESILHSDECTAETLEHLAAICTVEGDDGERVVDEDRMYNYAKLAGWATYLWLVGPLGKDFRYKTADLFSTAYDYGECILSESWFFPPTMYRKLDRAPRSCYRCGIDAWCTEVTSMGDTTRYICESCLSKGMPPLDGLCGSKMCRWALCPNHPYHQMGSAGIKESYRSTGAIGAGARERAKALGAQEVKRLH
jgi:hypothetical protein